MALSPHLFIGVGGTGGKTIGVIRERMLSKLATIGRRELPRGWQFLHIDVPADPDARLEGMPYALPRSQYVGLTAATSTFSNVSMGLTSRLNVAGRDGYLAWDCWRPFPPESVNVIISHGAGQFRGVGRVASQYGLANIAGAIGRALEIMNDPETPGEFRDIQRDSGATHIDMAIGTPTVYIVGSVAGGSGSGMLLDVCDVVNSQGLAQPAAAIVFTPEVFAHSDGTYDKGIAPNTFMAISELANAMWTTHQPGSSSRDTLFARAGLSRATGFGGPGSVFLVGRSSARVTLTEPDEVYSVVGHALANVAQSDELSNSLNAYVKTNLGARATGAADHLALSPLAARDLGLFGALGFGRMSLGRDYFDRYSSERLFRMAALRLMDQHLSLHYPGDGKTDEQVLKEAADRAWPSFLNATGINEAGDNNNIIDALDPLADMEAELSTFTKRVAQDITGNARARVETAAARAAASAMVLQSRDGDTGALTHATTHMANKMPTWSHQVSDQLRNVVVATAAQEGLPVTIELLSRLTSHSIEALGEIRGIDARRAEADLRAQHQRLTNGRLGEERRIRIEDTAALTAIGRQARRALELEIRIRVLRTAGLVLEDLIENLLQPWLRAVRDADDLLRTQLRPANRHSPLDRMPDRRSIPGHLRPSRVEYLLDDIEEFPATFVTQVAYSAGGDVNTESEEGLGSAVDDAVTQIIAADRLNPLGKKVRPPAVYDEFWQPEFGAKRARTRAKIITAFNTAGLEERVFSWLHDDRKSVGRYLAETLPSHLGSDTISEADTIRRHDRLVNQFSAALQVAAPLVSLDPTLVQAIHQQGTPPVSASMSALSIPEHLTALRSRVEDAAVAVLGPGARVSFSTQPGSDVTILSSLDNPYHALEVASIMEPISSQWMADSDNPDFWLWRRTGPLQEWVPLSPRSRACLLQGWFAARFLGRARYLPDASRHEVYVDNPGGGGAWLPLGKGVRPFSLLDHVANLVETLPVALIEAFHAKSLKPLQPYQTLIALGGQISPTSEKNPLRTWVATGHGLIDPDSAYCPSAVDAAARREEFVATCDKLIANYGKYSQDAMLTDVASSQTQPRHEIYADVIAALTALRSAVLTAVDDTSDLL